MVLLRKDSKSGALETGLINHTETKVGYLLCDILTLLK